MKYKTSFFNIAIIIEDLKRLWGLAALYFLAVFFTGPLQIMLMTNNSNRNPRYNIIENFLNIRGMEIQVAFSIAFAIILAMLIFRYLHTDKSATVIHAFPITRKQLYNSHNIAGLILLLAPVVINTIVLLLLMSINNDGSILFEEVYTTQNLGIWMGKTVLVNSVVYLFAVLTAMVTGVTLIQGVLAFVIIFLPLGLGTLVLTNLDQLLYGFVSNNSAFNSIVVKILPVTSILDYETFSAWFTVWYILLDVILYIGAYYFYKNRQLERASDPIAFDVLKPIFKYGVTFCTMVLGGAYFYSMKNVDIWLYLGYIIGGYLGYILAEMLIQKTVWVFKNVKGLIIYTMIIIIAFIGLKLDVTGFERRVPEVDNIANVYYGSGLYGYWNGNEEGLEDINNIKLVRELHEKLINNRSQFTNAENNFQTNRIGIVYELNNGRTISREYEVPLEFMEDNQYIKEIYESKEYKTNYYQIFSADVSTIEYVEINPHAPTNRNVKMVDSSEINEMIEVIKADILNETYEEFQSSVEPWANIRLRKNITLEEPRREEVIHLSWKKSYDGLSNWMKEKGYYENARVMPEDIDYMVIQELENNMEINEVYRTMETKGIIEGKHKVEIRDKDKIEYFLNNYGNNYPESKKYVIGFYLNNGSNFIGWINEEDVPSDVIKLLK